MMTDFPAAFLEKMQQMLGCEYADFLAAMEREPERGLRLNPLREMAFSGDVVAWEEDGRYAPRDLRPGRDPAHFAGGYYMQDASAMAPARVLRAQPGEVVLDLCAAPGGKSGQIAAALGGEGVLVANEPDGARAKALSGNLERLGVRNALVVSAYPDALAKKWPEVFDAILVDAPCSGEGMFRRDAAARGEWTEKSPEGCAKRQRQILGEAAKMLKPNGRLVYSTCTFNEEENEGTVRAFLDAHDEFEAAGFALEGVGESKDGMLRLWPHKVRGEGHFVAMVRKNGIDNAAIPACGRVQKDEMAALNELRKAVPGAWPGLIEGWRLVIRGDSLWAMPERMPAFDGIKALRTGLQLCRIGRGYVKPEHALAMALSPGDVERALALDETEAQRFMRGEEIEREDGAPGWTLMTYRGMPLGWGKTSGGAVKNHVPKGVRVV